MWVPKHQNCCHLYNETKATKNLELIQRVGGLFGRIPFQFQEGWGTGQKKCFLLIQPQFSLAMSLNVNSCLKLSLLLFSVSCYATGEGMWPNLTFGEYNEMLVPQGLSRTQNSSSLWVTNGFSSEMLGLYTCATADYRIHHYVITAGECTLDTISVN